MSTPTTSLIQTHSLKKHFAGVNAVDNLSIEVQKGTITSIIGPNGSGKSTLINVLTGMQAIDGGAVVIDGIHLRKIHPWDIREYGLTRTFQEVRLFEQMSVLDNLLVVLTSRSLVGSFFERYTKHHELRAIELLQKVGLEEKRHQMATTLSYGQRKLLEIARALAMNPSVIFFDEPMAGLFPEMIKRVVAIIHELKAEGKTIIFVEHNMKLIREISDHLIVMDEGKLLAQGKPEVVLARRDVIEAYLGE